MKLYLGHLLLAAVTLAPIPAAHGADAIGIPLSGADHVLPVHDLESPADWSGFYAGIYGVAQASPVGGGQFGLGVLAGVNAQIEMVLVGAEVAVHGLGDAGAGTSLYGQVLGRAGLVVTEDVAVYAAAGYGLNLGAPGEQDFLLGGGLEFTVADDVSLRAQYLHSFPTQGGNPKDQVTFGATFHF